jgi:hypothetical protein
VVSRSTVSELEVSQDAGWNPRGTSAMLVAIRQGQEGNGPEMVAAVTRGEDSEGENPMSESDMKQGRKSQREANP